MKGNEVVIISIKLQKRMVCAADVPYFVINFNAI